VLEILGDTKTSDDLCRAGFTEWKHCVTYIDGE